MKPGTPVSDVRLSIYQRIFFVQFFGKTTEYPAFSVLGNTDSVESTGVNQNAAVGAYSA
jgi:hypothetical protein